MLVESVDFLCLQDVDIKHNYLILPRKLLLVTSTGFFSAGEGLN